MRKIKLLILIILSLSVYFIYQKNKDSQETIVVLGDYLSEGRDSFYSHTYTYMDYYKDFSNKKETTIKNYSQKDLTIKEMVYRIQQDSSLKRELREADLLILNLGYNDLLFKLSITERINQNNILQEITIDYNHLLTEIRRFYQEEIIILGYPQTYKQDDVQKEGIIQLNHILSKNKSEKDIFIDTDRLLNNKNKYFSNPSSNYPNALAYQVIGKEILRNHIPS